MHYLITGANGFIGSHLVRSILEKNLGKVSILIRKTSSIHRIKDLLSRLKVFFYEEGLFASENIDICYHLAWIGVANTYRNDDLYEKNNEISFFVLKLCRLNNIKKLIALGSQAEYGIKQSKVSEKDSLEPITEYGKSKKKISQMMKSYCLCHGIEFIWVRLFSSYGPYDQDCWLIPYVIKKYLSGKHPQLTAGEQLQDFLYISDVVDGLIELMRLRFIGDINLGSSSAVKIREVVEKIFFYVSPKTELIFGEIPYRIDQQYLIEADMSLFFSFTSWRPMVSLEDGIKKTIEYYKSFG